MRILILHPDAFGGRGGIAKFNRDFLTALAGHPATEVVTALPRYIIDSVGPLPARLNYCTFAARDKFAYLLAVLAQQFRREWYDLVVCAHINLLPMLMLLRFRAPHQVGLVLHGVEAWQPIESRIVRKALNRINWFIAVSSLTRQRFLAHTHLSPERGIVIPNSVDTARFKPGPRREDLLMRYGLLGRTIVMGLGRLEALEKAKGFDEVMEVLPGLLAKYPNLTYLICGDGTDRARLQAKARSLGIGDRVVFAGYVSESEKVDHYRLADCFVLAGWFEGFGIALIEAMACGIPVVASSLDGSCEAVVNGRMGTVVDPRDPEQLARAIEASLARPRGIVPPGIETFSYEAFKERLYEHILDPLARHQPHLADQPSH